MTNTVLACLTVTIVTNWTTVGTFIPSGSNGPAQVVEVGQIQTNVTAHVPWGGYTREFKLEPLLGPIVGERRVSQTLDTNIFQRLILSGGGLTNACQHEWAVGCGQDGCLVIHPRTIQHCIRCKSFRD